MNPAETRANRMVIEAVLDRLMILTGIGGVAKSATKQVSKSAAKSVARSAERSGVRHAGRSAARGAGDTLPALSQDVTTLTHTERQQMLEAFPHGLNRPVPSSSPRVDMSQFSGQMTPSGEISVRFVGVTPNPVPHNIRALEIQRMEYIMTQQLSEPGALIAGRGTSQVVTEAPSMVASKAFSCWL